MMFKKTQMLFQSDVFAAVAVVNAKALYCVKVRATEHTTGRRGRGGVSFSPLPLPLLQFVLLSLQLSRQTRAETHAGQPHTCSLYKQRTLSTTKPVMMHMLSLLY